MERRQELYESIKSRNQMVCSHLCSQAYIAEELDVTATLSRTVEKFARKIEQLAIIKEVGILVVLAGMPSSP